MQFCQNYTVVISSWKAPGLLNGGDLKATGASLAWWEVLGRAPLQGTGRRTLTRQDLLFLCRWNWLNQWSWWLGIETSSIPVCWEEHWGSVVGSMLWWFCEEADGKWVCFHGNKMERKKGANNQVGFCSECCVKAVFFFWAADIWLSAQSSENPTKQRVGQGIGQPWRIVLGTSAGPSPRPPSQR